MEYKIIVAKNDRAQFPRCTSVDPHYVYVFYTVQEGNYNAKRAYKEIAAKFPAPMYKITVELWKTSGHEVDPDEEFE